MAGLSDRQRRDLTRKRKDLERTKWWIKYNEQRRQHLYSHKMHNETLRKILNRYSMEIYGDKARAEALEIEIRDLEEMEYEGVWER